MEKLVYLCWKQPALPIEAFREHWLGHTADAVLSAGAHALTLNIADLGARIEGCPLVLGEGSQWSACVSLGLDSLDARAALVSALEAQCQRSHGFENHPFRQYIRNAVARGLTPTAAPYRGIVEERVAELEDALDMRRFFRGSSANMRRGMADVDSFLDRSQIAATLMSEYIIKA